MKNVVIIPILSLVLAVAAVSGIKTDKAEKQSQVQAHAQEAEPDKNDDPPQPAPEATPAPVNTDPEPPKATQAPKQAKKASYGDCEAYRHLLERYEWNVDTAMQVMRVESGCNPDASNMNDVHKDSRGNVICVGSFGLMQISCHGGRIFDPVKNIEAAYAKWKARGWQPWGATTCKTKVKCI